MRLTVSLAVFALAATVLGGCENPYAAAPAPDHRIRLIAGPDGALVAVPPPCPDWGPSVTGPLQNEPWPQYGCANARNLAAMVDRPEDLVQSRDLGPASGTRTSLAMRRYNAVKTMPLIDPNAKTPQEKLPTMDSQDEKGGMAAAQ